MPKKVPTVAEVRNATTPAQAASVRKKLLETPPPHKATVTGRANAITRGKGKKKGLRKQGY